VQRLSQANFACEQSYRAENGSGGVGCKSRRVRVITSEGVSFSALDSMVRRESSVP
jgi:hypothetical protein